MASVKLHGLKIAHSRGKYYVYVRSTGEILIKGFEGDKAALLARLAMPDVIGSYNSKRQRDPKSYPEKTLGWLVAWFIGGECPEYNILADATKTQYKSAYEYLEPEFDIHLDDIAQSSLYTVRDKCSAARWPRFADQMITALSSMFREGIKRGKMKNNPARGMDRAHQYDQNANREWLLIEWTTAYAIAPLKFKIAMMIARYVGYRGQSIAKVQWSHYQLDPAYGKCFRFTHKKNSEQHWVPAEKLLQKFLNGLDQTSTYIATKENGVPWDNEKQLQIGFSNWIASIEKRGLVNPGLTLHGLRVTYAADKKRKHGATDSAVAAALGDKTPAMGTHYTRHVENEIKVIQAFGRPDGKKKRRT